LLREGAKHELAQGAIMSTIRFLIRHSLGLTACISLALAGCASTPGGRPHDMSAAAHEAHAQADQKLAQVHRSQYDSNADVIRTRCSGPAERVTGGPCWTDITNPTDEHLDQARRHARMAADHRAASRALRDAEARACAGISEADRDRSPFAHKQDILMVEPVTRQEHAGKVVYKKPAGARITFRAVPGMTAEWLQQAVSCHIARNAVLGHDRPEMAYCPLDLKGVQAQVSSTGTGFAVDITADRENVATEINHRAMELRGPR
jgi:hypothetical protein